MADDQPRVQTVRNAWTNALRAEVLRVGRKIPELSRIATVGVWIATYADADGGGAFPSRETLGQLAGCTTESVTRVVKVLIAVGMLQRKRRPNQSSMYQLVMPVVRPDWAAHIYLYTDTRQRRAHAKKKEREVSEAIGRMTSPDAVRTTSTAGVPDSVHGGLSETDDEAPDGVHGRPGTASMDAIRTASMAGSYQYLPTSGRDPEPDHDSADHSPQPQVDAGAPARKINYDSEQDDQAPDAAPGLHGVPRPPVGHRERKTAAVTQPPILLSVPTGYAELRAAAEAQPGLVREAFQQLGHRRAVDMYGRRLVQKHASDLIGADHRTGTDD